MSRAIRITILGCGSSGGVPRVGQGWGSCDPANPKNRRRRCSILVERIERGLKTVVLIDTSPDLRQQLLDADVERLDAILFTHSHADHTHGIDDVRPLVIAMRKRIDVYADAVTSQVLRTSFGYIFETPLGSQYPSLLNEKRLVAGELCRIEGPGGPLDALPFRLEHGEIDALGFRIEGFAYTPDLCAVPEASLAALKALDLWIIDCLRYTRHPSHLSLSEALALIERLQPRRAVLTNLHTDLDYERLRQEIPAHVEPAFDGMQLDL
jgi:phosphoribosyl 1,2-cyclic phosphate phosphodiesterase